MALEHRIRIVTNAIVDKLKDNAGPLGLEFIGSYDEKRIPRYPAVVVSPGDRVKTQHGTNTFNVELAATLWVYHGDLTVPHRVRSEEDLKIVDEIEALFESDYTLGGLVIFGFFVSQVPSVVQASSPKREVIAGTRMDWVGLTQRRMRA